MKYILWDIDGTLLLTGKAGIAALKEAIKQRFGKKDYEFTHGLAGRTDSFIIKEAVTDIKGRCAAGDAAGLLITYNQLLPRFMDNPNGKVLPHVITTLQYLTQKPEEYTNTVLTGNCMHAAYTKLKYYHLESYFSHQHSVFGEISEERNLLAAAALQKIQMLDPQVNPTEDIIIVGDTPHDVACAKAIGAKSIIILAGGFYSLEEIHACQPWKILPELPTSPEEFEEILKGN